jgi:hypothetical protein
MTTYDGSNQNAQEVLRKLFYGLAKEWFWRYKRIMPKSEKDSASTDANRTVLYEFGKNSF